MFIQIILYFVCFQKCLSFDLPSLECTNGLKINDKNYVKTRVYDIGDAQPNDIHYDTYGNLFYVESGENDSEYYYNIHIIKSNESATPQKVQGLPHNESYSIAVDNKADKVYFGTKLGIYRYNYKSNNATPITTTDFEMNMLFVDKNGNKFVTVNNDGIQELYLLDGERKIPFKTLDVFNEIEIDTKNNFYFIRGDNLYVLNSNMTIPVVIGHVDFNDMGQIAIYNSNIFIASGKLAYIHENDTGKLKYAENVPENVTSIAFDNNGDIALGRHGQLLKYNKYECESEKSRVVDEFSETYNI